MLLAAVIGYGVIGVEEAAVEVEQVCAGCTLLPPRRTARPAQPLGHAPSLTRSPANPAPFSSPQPFGHDFNDIPLDVIVKHTHESMASFARYLRAKEQAALAGPDDGSSADGDSEDGSSGGIKSSLPSPADGGAVAVAVAVGGPAADARV